MLILILLLLYQFLLVIIELIHLNPLFILLPKSLQSLSKITKWLRIYIFFLTLLQRTKRETTNGIHALIMMTLRLFLKTRMYNLEPLFLFRTRPIFQYLKARILLSIIILSARFRSSELIIHLIFNALLSLFSPFVVI